MILTGRRLVTLRDVAIVLALGATVLVPSLFTRDPWNPDEPRYAEVAREMVVSGDYLVPHLNSEIYPDKPPLFFWMTAGLMRLGFGINAGRVVAAVFAAGTLLLVYHLGRRLWGREAGLWAALVTLTTLLFVGISKFGVLDPPLTFCIVAAISCALVAMEGEGRRRGGWWLGFYGAMAAGVLIKGPVAVAVPGLIVLAYGLVCRKALRGGGWWHLAGVALFAGLVASWLIPAVLKGGKAYATEIVFSQTARRLAESPSHQKPFYFYLAYSPLFFLPWSLILPLALVSAWKAARHEQERQSWLPVLWFAVILVFFSLVSGKRERYILPAVPAVGLLLGRYVTKVMHGALPWPKWHRWLWRATLVLGVVVAVAAAGATLWPESFVSRYESGMEASQELRGAAGPWLVVAALLPLAAVVAAALYAVRLPADARSEKRRVPLLVGGMVALSLLFDLVATPYINLVKSGAYFADKAKPYIDSAEDIYLHRQDYSGLFNLFLRRERMAVLETDADLAEAMASKRRVAVIVREKHWLELRGKVPGSVAVRDTIGHRTMALVVNWESEAQTMDTSNPPWLTGRSLSPRIPPREPEPWVLNHPLRGIKSETLTYTMSARASAKVQLGTITVHLFREGTGDERQLVIEAKAKGGVIGYPFVSTITSRLRDSDYSQIVEDQLRTRPTYKRGAMRWTDQGVDYLRHRHCKDAAHCQNPRHFVIQPDGRKAHCTRKDCGDRSHFVWRLSAQHQGLAPERTYGMIAACYLMRGVGLEPGGPSHTLRVVFKKDLWDVSIRAEEETVVVTPLGKIPCYRISLKPTPVSEHAKKDTEDSEGPFGLSGDVEFYADKETKQLVQVRGQIEFGVLFEVVIMLTGRTVEKLHEHPTTGGSE